jgi:hypothetical protein
MNLTREQARKLELEVTVWGLELDSLTPEQKRTVEKSLAPELFAKTQDKLRAAKSRGAHNRESH